MSASSLKPWASMTGFAQAEFSLAGRQFRLQMKSVNHRFFEFRLRAPRELQMMENDLRAWCKDELQRGSVDFSVDEARIAADSPAGGDGDSASVQSFVARLARAVKATSAQWDELGVLDKDRVLILAGRPEFWPSEETAPSGIASSDASRFEAPVRALCAKLVGMRLVEGEQTRRSVVAHGMDIRRQWSLIRAELPVLRDAWAKGLEDRLQKLSESFTGGGFDTGRAYQEFVILADKRDVSEEIQRIDSHLSALETLADAPTETAVGKRLDFIAQELNREWTTLSNKIQDARINRHVGETKLTIEKIREQCLNLV